MPQNLTNPRRVPVRVVSWLLLVALAVPDRALAIDISYFEKRMTVHVFENGLTLLVCRRPRAPVFSYHALVDVGSADDPPGRTGLAHMFEHMAFKGTDRLGTTDWAAEQLALARVEEAFARYHAARATPQAKPLQRVWRQAIAEADRFVVSGAFAREIERAGGIGLDATT